MPHPSGNSRSRPYIKGHWGGWAPEIPINLRRPWKFENLRCTFPETSCITSTFEHSASVCPPQKKTFLWCLNQPILKNMRKLNWVHLPPKFRGWQFPNVYWTPLGLAIYLIDFKELIVSDERICLAHATLETTVFPWEDVKSDCCIHVPQWWAHGWQHLPSASLWGISFTVTPPS